MKRCFFTRTCTGLLLLAGSQLAMAQPTPAGVAAFNAYAGTVESRLAHQHRSDDAFLAANQRHDLGIGIQRHTETVAIVKRDGGAEFH